MLEINVECYTLHNPGVHHSDQRNATRPHVSLAAESHPTRIDTPITPLSTRAHYTLTCHTHPKLSRHALMRQSFDFFDMSAAIMMIKIAAVSKCTNMPIASQRLARYTCPTRYVSDKASRVVQLCSGRRRWKKGQSGGDTGGPTCDARRVFRGTIVMVLAD